MTRRSPRFSTLLLCLPLALLAFAWAARGGIVPVGADPSQALVVTSTADDGAGSLRQAIASAVDGGTITFAVGGDITLLRPLVIGKRLTIDGPGAEELAIRGEERVRLFRVAPGAALTLRGLTMADGVASDEPWNTPTPSATPQRPPTPTPPARFPPPTPFPTPTRRAQAAAASAMVLALPGLPARGRSDQPQPPTPTSPVNPNVDTVGGAINNQGVLTVEDCVFESNSAPGGGDGGQTGGGAIVNAGGLAVIRRSQFLRNSASVGGAIVNIGGPMTIVDSSFVANFASDQAVAILNNQARMLISGSLFLQNQGGAITGGLASVIFSTTQPDGELVVANSTFAHNDTTNAGLLIAVTNRGRTTVVNSTFLNSMLAGASAAIFPGGPITPSGHFTLINSLMVNTHQQPACRDNAMIDGGHNLQFPDGTCGATIPIADPLLDVWAQGSGPALTISLAPGSPAIDAGDPEACADWPVLGLDARGRLRGGDGNGDGIGGCDIGAFEAGASITATPTQTPTAGPSPTPSVTRTPSITPSFTPSRTPTDGPSPLPTISSVPPPRRTPTPARVTCTPPPCECGRLVGSCPGLRCLPCTATPRVPTGEAFLPIASRE